MRERREREIWGILGQGGDTCEEYIELGFCRILVNFVGILGGFDWDEDHRVGRVD